MNMPFYCEVPMNFLSMLQDWCSRNDNEFVEWCINYCTSGLMTRTFSLAISEGEGKKVFLTDRMVDPNQRCQHWRWFWYKKSWNLQLIKWCIWFGRDLVLLTWTLLPVVNPDLECYALGWFPLFTNTEKMLRRAKRTTGKENKNSQQTQIINPDKQSLKWDKITLKECKRGNVKIERIDIQIKRKH